MYKPKIIKPEHGCDVRVRVKNSSEESGWSEIEVPANFLSANNSGFTIGDVLALASSDDVVQILLYYPVPTALQTVYLEGLSQNSGLTISVFADDVVWPAIPATQIATRVQDAQSQRRRTANEMLSFDLATNSAFMIELSGIETSDGVYSANVLQGSLGDPFRGLGLGEIEKPTLMHLDLTWQVQSKAGSGVDPDIGVADIEVFNGVTSDVIYSATLNGDVSDGVMHFSDVFWIDTTMNHPSPEIDTSQLVFSVALDGSGVPENPPLLLSAEIKSFAERSNLGLEGLFLGVDTFEFNEGHDWGAEYSDFNTMVFSQSRSMVQASRGFKSRSRSLSFNDEDDLVLANLRDLMYELHNGFCLLDEIPTSDDPHTKILGFIEISGLSPSNVNRNKFDITIRERKEWH